MTNQTHKTITIVEDDILLANLMRDKINQSQKYICYQVFDSAENFLKKSEKSEIVLLDIMLGGMNGLDAIKPILSRHPDSTIIMNTIKDDSETIFKSLQLGASGYIDKQSFDLNFEEVFETLKNGGAYMTPKIAKKVIDYFHTFKIRSNPLEMLTAREMDIAQGILDGLSYQLIADRYGIALDTVRMNVKKIYKKLQINSKGELFNLAREN
jgi:DNA-binding NarL/FixJ family response regulator